MEPDPYVPGQCVGWNGYIELRWIGLPLRPSLKFCRADRRYHHSHLIILIIDVDIKKKCSYHVY